MRLLQMRVSVMAMLLLTINVAQARAQDMNKVSFDTLQIKASSMVQGNFDLNGAGTLYLAKDVKGYLGASYYAVDDKQNNFIGFSKTDAPPEAGKTVNWTGVVTVPKGVYTVFFKIRYLDADGKEQLTQGTRQNVKVPEDMICSLREFPPTSWWLV